MPKNDINSDTSMNQNSSDSKGAAVPILNDESEQRRLRILECVGEEKIRAFARRAEISEAALRSYLKGLRLPKQSAIAKIARAANKSTDWLTNGRSAHLLKQMAVTVHNQSEQTASLSLDGNEWSNLTQQLMQPVLEALETIHGERFSQEPAKLQIAYALEFIGLFVSMASCIPKDRNPLAITYMTRDMLNAQIQIFLKLGWISKYPERTRSKPQRPDGMPDYIF